MPTKLILIRHGETDWSCQKRYCGFTDVVLNQKGMDQARRLSKRLRGKKVHKVYSSDMKRTLEFARIAFKDAAIEQFPELREMNFGIFESLTYQEIMDRYPEIYTKWIDSPLDVTIPGGEGLKDLSKRTRKALAEILSRNKNRTVFIFSHAGPISVILCGILKLDLREAWKVKQDLASMSIVEFAKGRGKIGLLNDTSHLYG